jgi:hypothetical protein
MSFAGVPKELIPNERYIALYCVVGANRSSSKAQGQLARLWAMRSRNHLRQHLVFKKLFNLLCIPCIHLLYGCC